MMGEAGDGVADLPGGCGCLGDLHCLPVLILALGSPLLLYWMI